MEQVPKMARWRNQPHLSAAEIDVLRCVSHGMTEQMAADALGRGYETVRTQTMAARFKLQAHTTAEACCNALRLGLID
jgi:DNA-binding CsgD family transcriptional regulator